MKKIYLFIAIFLCIENSFAQGLENQANEVNSSNFEKENSRQKSFENRPNRDLKQNRNRPENDQAFRQSREGNKRPNFQNLSDEKKQLLKAEQEKHRQNVKNIAGIEIVFGEEERALSSEQNKARVENNSKIIEQLSMEKKELLKQENQRHRQQMQEITGFEMPEMPRQGNLSPEKSRNCKKPSSEEMEKHRQAMESLSPEKRQLVKKEMERHRLEMKNITGFDLPSPACND
jgi:hypothetical protein